MLRNSILTLCVAFSPMPVLAESTLAIAGASNGLYMSRDRGITWEKNAALGEVALRAVVIDRSDLRRLYAATGEALLVSEDRGATWSASAFPEPARIQRLISGGADMVYALVANAVWSIADGGKRWTTEFGSPTGILDLAVDAGDPPAIYATTSSGIFTKSGGSAWMRLPGQIIADRITADPDVPGRLFAASGALFAYTADGGATWTQLPQIPAETAAAARGVVFPGGLEVQIQMQFAALAAGQWGNDVIALWDNCTWRDGSSFPCGSDVLVLRKGVWRAMRLDPLMEPRALAADRASNLVLVGGRNHGVGLYRTTAIGGAWTAVDGFGDVTVNALASATVNVEPWSQVHAGTNEGWFSSIDGGETWQSNAALGKAEVFAIGVDRGGSGLLLASTPDGLFRSTDAGASWEKSELPPEVQAGVIAIDPKPDGRTYLVDKDARRTKRLRLWTSEDRGRSWYQVASQPELTTDVALDPTTTPATVYIAGTSFIQKSIDEARTWTWIDNRSSARFIRVGEPAGTIYRDGEEGIWKTVNDGNSWEITAPLNRIVAPERPPFAIWEWTETGALAIGTRRNDGLIAACATYFAEFVESATGGMESAGLFIVDGDGRHTFSMGETCTALDMDPRAAGLVYVGGHGLRRSRDAGRTWSSVPGFENLAVYVIATAPLRLASKSQ